MYTHKSVGVLPLPVISVEALALPLVVDEQLRSPRRYIYTSIPFGKAFATCHENVVLHIHERLCRFVLDY